MNEYKSARGVFRARREIAQHASTRARATRLPYFIGPRMPHARLLLLFVVARTCASLTPGLATFRRHTGTSPRTSRLCCTSVNDDDEAPPNYELSAYDISREVAKYNSPGLRIRQSGPVRKTFGAVADLFGQAGALAVFLRGAVSIVPFYGMMMAMLCFAFALQQSAPRAAMLAGARVNSAIQNGQWHRLVSPVFLHGGGMHLASNLFSLYRVGPLVEAALGPARAALLYLLSGIGGNLAGLWFGASRGMSIGASGAGEPGDVRTSNGVDSCVRLSMLATLANAA